MKVRVYSDLHLEFGPMDPGEGDVLVLAGDICTACSFTFRGEEDLRERYLDFFQKAVDGYNKVFYVLGNHEHYNYFFNETVDTLREHLPEGVTILDNQSEFYNGWHFVGATMWASYQDGNEDIMNRCSRRMNDFNYIYTNRDCVKLTPKDTFNEHKNTIEWFNQCLPTLNGNVIVITHHAPSYQSIEEEYKDFPTVDAYASNVEEVMERNENVRIWLHGHIHANQSYKIDDCHVVCNPRGYKSEDENDAFNPSLQLNLEKYV